MVEGLKSLDDDGWTDRWMNQDTDPEYQADARACTPSHFFRSRRTCTMRILMWTGKTTQRITKKLPHPPPHTRPPEWPTRPTKYSESDQNFKTSNKQPVAPVECTAPAAVGTVFAWTAFVSHWHACAVVLHKLKQPTFLLLLLTIWTVLSGH